MNICDKQILLLFLASLFFWGEGNGQAGINVKMGMETWTLKDEKEQSGQSKHPGQLIGIDVIVEKDRKLFVPGFHYHRISVENEDKSFNFDFSESHHAHYLSIPLAFGYKVLADTSYVISVLAGGEVNFFYDLDDNDIGLEEDMFYGVTTALTGIVHTEFFSFLTLEIKYHYGLQPIIKIRDDSKLRGWTIALGIQF